jgi:hypothetical protein
MHRRSRLVLGVPKFKLRDRAPMPCLGRRSMVVCADEGLKRNVTTGEAGRFNSVPLKPSSYSVRAKAESSRPRTNESVFSGLGQKQSVSFTLKVAAV